MMNGVPCPLASDVARYLWWTECDRSESLGLHVRDLVDELTPFTRLKTKKSNCIVVLGSCMHGMVCRIDARAISHFDSVVIEMHPIRWESESPMNATYALKYETLRFR